MATAISATDETKPAITASGWWQAGIVGVLIFLLFHDEIGRLVHIWSTDGNWSHGFVVPLFSAYFIYANKDQFVGVPVRANAFGLLILLAGIGVYFGWMADLIQFDILRSLALMMCIFGATLFLGGWRIMRILWLPILYLFFAIPIPDRIYVQLTMPLRHLAAAVSTAVLNLLPGVQAENAGVTINLMRYGQIVPPLNVADACSGMRVLIGLCALGVAITYLADRPNWQRITMVALCLPIAIFTNLVRVTTTGLFHLYGLEGIASGAGHAGWGIVMYSLALGLFYLVSWVLSRLFIDDEDETPSVTANPG